METRICKACEIEKSISCFGWTGKEHLYRKHICNTCRSKNYRKKPENRANCRRITKKCKEKYNIAKPAMKINLLLHINQTKCLFCGNEDIRTFCFHHRNPKNKSFNLQFGMTHSYSFEKLKIEAEKCDILCGCCHTIHHYNGTHPQAIKSAKIKNKLLETINKTCCQQCGCNKLPALAFHHLNPKEKEFKIAHGLTNNYSWNELLTEAEKCDILCVNCHMINHSKLDSPHTVVHWLANQSSANAYNIDAL